MGGRTVSRAFNLEAVKLVRDRGVAAAQACRDLEIAESVLRRWMRETKADPRHAVPGHDQLKAEQQEIDRLGREVAKLKVERDILNRPQPTSRGMRHEVRFHREA
jgi:transposase